MNSTRSFPLYWPESWPRTAQFQVKRARFGDHTVSEGRRVLADQVRLFGGSELIISSNLELRLDGNPRSNQKQPADRGVAVFFKRKGEDMALACDVYSTVEDNLWALCRTLDALRQIERDGSPSLINRAFKGFAALPDPNDRKCRHTFASPNNITLICRAATTSYSFRCSRLTKPRKAYHERASHFIFKRDGPRDLRRP